MTERKVYCKFFKHDSDRMRSCGSSDWYRLAPINCCPCREYKPTLLTRLKEWLTIKHKCNSCKWFNNKDCNIHGSTGIAYPAEYSKNNDCKHFELSLCKLFKEWLKGVFK